MEQLLLRRMIQSFSVIGCIVVIVFSIIVYHLKLEDTKDKLEDMLTQAITSYEEMKENNEQKISLNEQHYIKRAYAINYFLENDESSLTNEGLQKIKDLMEVDSIHLLNEEGKVTLSSESESIGLNLLKHEQAKPFWDLIQSKNMEDYVVQYEASNILDSKKKSFIGIKTKLKGYSVLQIGLKDEIFKNIIHEDIIKNVLHRMPTLYEEALVAINGKTGEVDSLTVNNSQEFYINGKKNGELLTYLKELSDGSIIKVNNKLQMISVEVLEDGTVLCAIYQIDKLFIDYLYLILFMCLGLIALLFITLSYIKF